MKSDFTLAVGVGESQHMMPRAFWMFQISRWKAGIWNHWFFWVFFCFKGFSINPKFHTLVLAADPPPKKKYHTCASKVSPKSSQTCRFTAVGTRSSTTVGCFWHQWDDLLVSCTCENWECRWCDVQSMSIKPVCRGNWHWIRELRDLDNQYVETTDWCTKRYSWDIHSQWNQSHQGKPSPLSWRFHLIWYLEEDNVHKINVYTNMYTYICETYIK